MRYVRDHDYHLHSHLSLCSGDPEQTPERILRYAREYGLKSVCLTDHYWDEAVPGASDWYKVQDTAHIRQALPLPQDENIRFYFGAEIDMDRNRTIGLTLEHFDNFDFVVIPTTHLHMMGFTLTEEQGATLESRAGLWIDRFDYLLRQPLPFYKIGIAHLTCSLIAPGPRENFRKVLNMITDRQMEDLFSGAREVGMGIELNGDDMMHMEDDGIDTILRPYRIAKEQGCKFYLGSDGHRADEMEGAQEPFERAIDLLGLEESDKFHIGVR